MPLVAGEVQTTGGKQIVLGFPVIERTLIEMAALKLLKFRVMISLLLMLIENCSAGTDLLNDQVSMHRRGIESISYCVS
jgi:hypothetical protein